MQLSIHLQLVFLETCTNWELNQDLKVLSPYSSPAMICFLVFHWILCFGWFCLLPCVCADWEGTAFFPSRLFHAVLGTHNLFYFHSFAFHIQVCFLRERPASPRLFSFLTTQTQWWLPKENFSGVEMPRWARVGCTGEVHVPFCWDFQAVSCQPASSLLLCSSHHSEALSPGSSFWSESFSLSLAEAQDNKFSLQCSVKWAAGLEVQRCAGGITLSYVVLVSTSRLLSDLALVRQFLPLPANSVPLGSTPLQPRTKCKWFFLTPKCTFLSHLFFETFYLLDVAERRQHL